MLRMFREHLAEELRGFPQEPGPSFQSYAVTTAALARIILEYLGMDDLTVPARFGGAVHRLRTVLDHIIHFREIWPDSLPPSGKTVAIMVYSDRTRLYGDRLHVSWPPYREMLLRLADDDVFVARYLLRRTVTVLMQSIQRKKTVGQYVSGHQSGEYRRRMDRLALDAWDIVVALIEAGKAEVPEVAIDFYEELFDEGKTTRHSRCSTCRDMVEGYGKTWSWLFFNPDEVNIGGTKVWCMFIREMERKEDGTVRGLAVPLDALTSIFQDVRAQLQQ